MHFLTGFVISIALFVYLGFEKGFLVDLIRFSPNSWFLVNYVGHGPKCIFLCVFFLGFSSILMIILKKIFYRLIAIVYGVECFSDQDDLYHFDMQANTTNIPVTWVTERPKNMGTPNQHFDTMVKRMPNVRINCKLTKVLGKWFFKTISDD